jgi:hypothetical protein
MSYRVEVKGRDGLVAIGDWIPAPSWVTGKDETASTLFTLKQASAFAQQQVAPRCAYAIRIVDEDGSALFIRGEQG